MGNAIKNYERKKRREQRDAQRKIRRIFHDAIISQCGFPKEFKEKETEIFDFYNRMT